MNRYMSLIVNEVLPFSLAAEPVCYRSEDHRESVRAFTEKTPAR